MNNPSDKVMGYDSGNNASVNQELNRNPQRLDWKRNEMIKKCEFCNRDFTTKSLQRLCPVCRIDKREIDAVRQDRPYTQMSPEMKQRVLERILKAGRNKPNR